jgi:hypothetical protein
MTGTIFHDHDLVDGRRRENRSSARRLTLNSAAFPRTAMQENTMALTTEQRRHNKPASVLR